MERLNKAATPGRRNYYEVRENRFPQKDSEDSVAIRQMELLEIACDRKVLNESQKPEIKCSNHPRETTKFSTSEEGQSKNSQSVKRSVRRTKSFVGKIQNSRYQTPVENKELWDKIPKSKSYKYVPDNSKQ